MAFNYSITLAVRLANDSFCMGIIDFPFHCYYMSKCAPFMFRFVVWIWWFLFWFHSPDLMCQNTFTHTNFNNIHKYFFENKHQVLCAFWMILFLHSVLYCWLFLAWSLIITTGLYSFIVQQKNTLLRCYKHYIHFIQFQSNPLESR